MYLYRGIVMDSSQNYTGAHTHVQSNLTDKLMLFLADTASKGTLHDTSPQPVQKNYNCVS